MNDDYAIEPEALAAEAAFFTVMDSMGFEKGRFIVEFPKAWRREIYETLRGWPDGPRQLAARRALEIAARSGVFVRSGLPYRPDHDWRMNLRECSRPFSGVLVSDAARCTGIQNCVSSDDLFGEKREVFLGSKTSDTFLPSAKTIGEMCRRLIEASRELVIVDPFFRLHRKPNAAPLKELISIASKTDCRRFLLFTGEKEDLAASHGAVAKLEGAPGFVLSVFQVDKELAAEQQIDFHPRFVFSIKGGIQFDYGLREDKTPRLASCAPDNIVTGLCDRYLANRESLPIVDALSFRFDGDTGVETIPLAP